MRRRLVLTIAAFQIALGGVAAAETFPCKQDPRIIQQCFAVRGRLSVHANMRLYLWPIGTNRLLGVASPDGAIIIPAELERLFAALGWWPNLLCACLPQRLGSGRLAVRFLATE